MPGQRPVSVPTWVDPMGIEPTTRGIMIYSARSCLTPPEHAHHLHGCLKHTARQHRSGDINSHRFRWVKHGQSDPARCHVVCVVVAEPPELLRLVATPCAGSPCLGLLGETPVPVLPAHVPRAGVFRLPAAESHASQGTAIAESRAAAGARSIALRICSCTHGSRSCILGDYSKRAERASPNGFRGCVATDYALHSDKK